MVDPGEVGAGLQSLMDLALLESVQNLDGNAWLLIEEPEAFLHPSAQRVLATRLFGEHAARRIISTHGPIIIDEAKFGDVVLIRDHRLFEPDAVEARRDEINSALMTGTGAEALYSRSLLLVEGPGDRAFFETLRRRVARVDKTGLAATLGIVAVGGKTRFRPWISLLQSYSDSATGELPVRWIAMADSVDATSDLTRAFREAGLSLPIDAARLVSEITRAFAGGQEEEGIRATREFNEQCRISNFAMHLLPIDLEYGTLNSIDDATVESICSAIGIPPCSKVNLMRKLGSKAGEGPSNDSVKSDWTRVQIARLLSRDEFPPDVILALRRWLLGAFDDPTAVEALLATDW
jgi:hypothetical protein